MSLISEMSWMDVERYLVDDDRAIIPLGSTEQHAYLSLSVDSILSSRLAKEVAEPLGVPVFPVVHYGLTPYFMAYPGTVTLRLETYAQLLTDIMVSLKSHGFRRILFVNGHGGNKPVLPFLQTWADENELTIQFHNWWSAPETWAAVEAVDSHASHASWSENFPWTRLANSDMPAFQKPMVAIDSEADPAALRAVLGDGNYGGDYQKEDAVMEAIWAVAVAETRALLEKL